ncbi:hypothetical protein [Natrononativus amylolyticus]|uniref:hypothetical protein n=1 Tax=Natrononativus amylolyticus TaxID=2963434 RepID=UPI0020CE129C|nr:hypothetical protein [Natrononativus amylolyticus]
MSTANSTQDHPFANPLVRHGIGLSGAAILALVAVFFLEGTMMYLVLGLAVLDAVAVPKFLEHALEDGESA